MTTITHQEVLTDEQIAANEAAHYSALIDHHEGRPGIPVGLPEAMMIGWFAFWRGDRPEPTINSAKTQKPRAWMKLWEIGYQHAWRRACKNSYAPVRATDAKPGMTYHHSRETIVRVTRNDFQTGVVLHFDKINYPAVNLRNDSIMWVADVPAGVNRITPALLPSNANRHPAECGWVGITPDQKEITVSPESEHRDQSQNAGDRARDPKPSKTRIEVEREEAPTDTWSPKNKLGGFSHLVQEFLASDMHLMKTSGEDAIALGVLQSWASGTLPTKYDHIALAKYLGLSIRTVNRYALRQWLHTYRDLDKNPLNTNREAGSILFQGMLAAGIWFNDLHDMTGFTEPAARQTIAMGKRMKPRVQAAMKKHLSLAIPDYGDQTLPFEYNWPEKSVRDSRARAFAAGSDTAAPAVAKVTKVVNFSSGVGTPAPVKPQQPVAAPAHDDFADSVHARNGDAWGQLSQLALNGFIQRFSIEEPVSVTGQPAKRILVIYPNNGGEPMQFDLDDGCAYRAVQRLRSQAETAITNGQKLLRCTGGLPAALQTAK